MTDIVTAHGGTALMNRVGHAFIKRRMRETNAVFGGEVTGHYYFRDNYYCDNGLIPALLMLELMSKKGKSLHELLAPLREKYFISGEINTKLAHMDHVGPKLDAIAKKYADGKQYTSRRALGRICRLALQRAAVEHRAAAPPEPRSEDAEDDGGKARRGTCADSLVTRAARARCDDSRRRRTGDRRRRRFGF